MIADAENLRSEEDYVPSDVEPSGIELIDRKLDLSTSEDARSMLQVFGLTDLSECELERSIDIAYSGRYGLEVYEDGVVDQDSTRKVYLEFWGAPVFSSQWAFHRDARMKNVAATMHPSSQRVTSARFLSSIDIALSASLFLCIIKRNGHSRRYVVPVHPLPRRLTSVTTRRLRRKV